MSVIEVKDMTSIAPLYEGWQESTIWSCLEGTMGNAYTVKGREGLSAKIVLGDFCFPAGEPSPELLRDRRANDSSGFQIIVPRTREMADCILTTFGELAEKKTRYAIKKEGDVFDHELLRCYANAYPEDFQVDRINRELFNKILLAEWSRDFVANFENYDEFEENALGYVMIKDGKIVAGASSYSYYKAGIEIEIVTKEEYRQRGFALCCGANLILATLEQGRYPNWDAANLKSVGLATKLGYHLDHPYDSYHIH